MRDLQIGASPLAAKSGAASRLRAFGKAAVYLIIAFASLLAVSAILKASTGQTVQSLMQGGSVQSLIVHAGLFLSLVAVPTTLSLMIWKEPFSFSGWSFANSARLASVGLATGGGLMVLFVITLWALGAWSGSFATPSIGDMAGAVLIWAAVWLVQAAHEEGLHRGYPFVQLSRSLSFWPAASLLSLWFLWGHVGQEGATAISLVVAGLFAMVLAYSFLHTGSLWFALGFHSSWNFAQSSLFGMSNSGGESEGVVLLSRLNGPPLLTGGTAGPEGSLLSLVAVVAVAAVVRYGLPERPKKV